VLIWPHISPENQLYSLDNSKPLPLWQAPESSTKEGQLGEAKTHFGRRWGKGDGCCAIHPLQTQAKPDSQKDQPD
jgi:hypothetical protein